jgi:hypothetical protein
MTGEALPSGDQEISDTQRESFITAVRLLLGDAVQTDSDVFDTAGNIGPEQHLAVSADRRAEYYVGTSLILLAEEHDLTGTVDAAVTMSVDTTTIDTTAGIRSIKREEYEVSADGEHAQHIVKTLTRSIQDLPTPAPGAAPDQHYDEFAGLSLEVITELRKTMGRHRFTTRHLDDAFKILGQCGPHNRLL